MQPSFLGRDKIETFLRTGDWSRKTMLDGYAAHAARFPDSTACRDESGTLTWEQLETVTDHMAANLVDLGLARDSTALVRMPSSCREVIVRIAFKKAGIIGVFAPMQWRRRELDHVKQRIAPGLAIMALERADDAAWLEDAFAKPSTPRIDLSPRPAAGWLGWQEVTDPPGSTALGQISGRRFAFDEVSLITASSGTSGFAKLCEWPEAAQLCAARGVAARLGLDANDNVGIFAPMSGAAGLLVWLASGEIPCGFTFPGSYRPACLLESVREARVTVGTTVPVVLARLAREALESQDLSSLRALRVGTAAADLEAALSFESRTGCRVVVASGSMECPGFAHADVEEPRDVRLNGSVGRPLPGCRMRIAGEDGAAVPARTVGELQVSAPYASSGYWRDPEATRKAWSGGWYATGDIARIDSDGRLRLLGRIKDVINRSGHKILPIEIEREISGHPDILECAVVKAPDADYGEVPWAFVQPRPGASLDASALAETLRRSGLASYKIPARFIELTEFPRISDNKIDRKALLGMASP